MPEQKVCRKSLLKRAWPRRLSWFLVLLLASFMGADMDGPGRSASAQHGASATRLALASAEFGPIALNAIIAPDTLEQIARQMRDKRWKLPAQDEVWPLKNGTPLVKTPRLDELWHTLQPGESLKRLRDMYKVNTPMLQTLNPGVDLKALDTGDRIRVWKRADNVFARSWGAPNAGRLFNGEPLPPNPNYRILYPHRTFGTFYTVSEVTRVLNNFYQTYPDASKIMIGDISLRRGYQIAPHASHRSGRDIDISYPLTQEPRDLRRFHYLRRGDLDVPQMLSILKDFLDGGYVQYVFMDRWIQRALRAEALRQGATKEWVERVFQYPDFSGGSAIVRYSPGHKNHFHVRFTCQPTDQRCS